MINSKEILETIRMIQDECLDIRTTTMGISLLDCGDTDIDKSCQKIYDKICKKAEHLVSTGEQIEKEYGIPIINKRVSVTPIAIMAGISGGDPELSRFWGLHAISMWKDPIYAVAVYFYSLKLFDLIYSRGAVSKDKKYILQCVVAILIICFFRHNGQYVALVSLLLMISCFAFAKNKYMVKKGLILSIAITILFSGIVQGPVYRRFGIEGTATGAYGIPLQQVARTVVYEGNISNEEKSFLNEIMPLEKYIDNYSPGLVDHMKWSEDFNTEFFKEHKKEFLKVWMSLLIKNPILFIEAWAMETCGFWGLSYWELNDFDSNITMGAPRETSELKKVYDITSGSLLGENSSIDLTVKKYFSVVTQMPSVALCLWISLFMILYALVEGKWRYLLFFIPCLGNIATLLVATPITYWPRYGLSFICLLPISALFPYLLKELEES